MYLKNLIPNQSFNKTFYSFFQKVFKVENFCSALPRYITMWVIGLERITQKSIQNLLRPGWRQVAVDKTIAIGTGIEPLSGNA